MLFHSSGANDGKDLASCIIKADDIEILNDYLLYDLSRSVVGLATGVMSHSRKG